MKKKGYSLVHVIIIVIITSIVSAITTGVLFTKNLINNEGINYTEFALDSNIQSFLDAYSEITNGYYENINKKEIIESAIKGMMSYLDESYTSYLSEEAADNLFEQLNGTYDGIGVTIQKDTIISVFDNSPAERAGILPGDKIISINEISVEGQDIVYLIKQHADNIVLEVERNNEIYTFNLRIETLNVPSVQYKMIENTNIGYLKISVFSSHLTAEMSNALTKLENDGMKKLIIDLRNNTGGYLEQSFSTASIFLKKGKVVYSLQNRNDFKKIKDTDNQSTDYPIVVLVNKATASASEILASALKDSYNATLVGTTTYGKGRVQQTYSLNTGGIVKYTSSKWLRPNGTCVDKVGITPDYIIENEYVYDENDPESIVDIIDHQLDKAIELLSD